MSGRVPGAAADGDVGHGPQTDSAVIERNRDAFITEAGFSMADLVISRQTHGTNVAIAVATDRGRGLYPAFDGFPATDAMVTNESSVALGTIVADCVPILLYDPRQHALGLAHAGWRGTVGQIAAKTVRTMTDAFDTDPNDIVAGIGPSIGPCCYEVGREVIDAWQSAGLSGWRRAVIERGSGYHLDLWAANRLVLINAGVPDRQIEYSADCVRCEHERFFSYRATRQIGRPPGRNLMVAQLLPA
jgi:YfiH family protein